MSKKLINNLTSEKNISSEDLINYSVDTILTDEKTRTIWINGMPYGNTYLNTDENGISDDAQPTNAEIFNDFENNKATGNYSHAEGLRTEAKGIGSHTEGSDTSASGNYSHAEGYRTIAYGTSSHAEGCSTNIFDNISSGQTDNYEAKWDNAYKNKTDEIDEMFSMAYGHNSHVEGKNNIAIGVQSHAEGYATKAKGNQSHTEGKDTTAAGDYSHAEGLGTKTTNEAEHACGRYNVSTAGDDEHGTIFSVGIGSSTTPKNAIEITNEGDIYIGADNNGNNPCSYPGTESTPPTTLQSLIRNQAHLDEVTYEELKEMRDTSTLAPGKFYRIVDYITTTTQEDTVSAGYQFDIVVLALSTNTLSEDAWAVQHDFSNNDNNVDMTLFKTGYTPDKKLIKYNDEIFEFSESFLTYTYKTDTNSQLEVNIRNVDEKEKIINNVYFDTYNDTPQGVLSNNINNNYENRNLCFLNPEMFGDDACIITINGLSLGRVDTFFIVAQLYTDFETPFTCTADGNKHEFFIYSIRSTKNADITYLLLIPLSVGSKLISDVNARIDNCYIVKTDKTGNFKTTVGNYLNNNYNSIVIVSNAMFQNVSVQLDPSFLNNTNLQFVLTENNDTTNNNQHSFWYYPDDGTTPKLLTYDNLLPILSSYFSASNLSAWKIWYCLENDKTRFAWADKQNGKGVIYRMIDEFGNDCPYDFKNIMFMNVFYNEPLYMYTFNFILKDSTGNYLNFDASIKYPDDTVYNVDSKTYFKCKNNCVNNKLEYNINSWTKSASNQITYYKNTLQFNLFIYDAMTIDSTIGPVQIYWVDNYINGTANIFANYRGKGESIKQISGNKLYNCHRVRNISDNEFVQGSASSSQIIKNCTIYNVNSYNSESLSTAPQPKSYVLDSSASNSFILAGNITANNIGVNQ